MFPKIYNVNLKDGTIPVVDTDYILVWSQTFKRRIKFLQTHNESLPILEVDLLGLTHKSFQQIQHILAIYINKDPQEVKEFSTYLYETDAYAQKDILDGIKYLNIIIMMSPTSLIQFSDIVHALFKDSP